MFFAATDATSFFIFSKNLKLYFLLKRPVFSRTKIVATIGPASQSKEMLQKMIEAGMNVARLNFSHGNHEQHARQVNLIRDFNEKLDARVAILQDLQGPKIRMGEIEPPFQIKVGDVLTFKTDIEEVVDGMLPIQYPAFAEDVEAGEPILVNDGKVELRVLETNKVNEVKLLVEFGAEIAKRKGVNLPKTHLSTPSITEKDTYDLKFAAKHGVDWLALSFVRSADDIKYLRHLLLRSFVEDLGKTEEEAKAAAKKIKIISKIEKPEAMDCLDEIIEVSDGIMVARGDLGVEIPMEDVPAAQKRIVRKANNAAKPVIVATQMMASMVTARRPTRAEASDVATAVVDGADAVMLSEETATGDHPPLVIKSMKRIIKGVEKEDKSLFHRNMELTGKEIQVEGRSIIIAACSLSKKVKAKAIVVMTRSGYTAFQIARSRPKADVYAFTDNKELVTTLNLVWGIRAFYFKGHESTDIVIPKVQEILKEKGLIKPGDTVINTASMPLHTVGHTNMLKITTIA